jgi:hypothetical protein
MGVIGERYAQHQGGARGAPHAQSKRQRLDVGVIPHCFLLVLVDRLVGLSGYFVDFRFSWLGWFVGSVGLGWVLFIFGGLLSG